VCFPDKDGAHSSVSGTLAAALEKTGARRNRASVATPTAARRGPARDRRRRRAGPLNAVQFCPARNTLHRFGKFRPWCVLTRQRQGRSCHGLEACPVKNMGLNRYDNLP